MLAIIRAAPYRYEGPGVSTEDDRVSTQVLEAQAIEGQCTTAMLTEDAVIDLLCDHLRRSGWTIQSTAMPNQRGIDIIATQAGVRLEVEAKGEGSSKPGTERYGKPFDRSQVQHRVGEALLTALAVAARDSAQAAIALPDIPRHHSVADPILPALHQLGIIVFWVGENGTVREDR